MGQVASGFILLLEGEISGECPYIRSLYEKYFVLTNFRSEAVEFFELVEWRSRINSETLGVRMETVCPNISQSSPNVEMTWEVWG